MQWRRLFWKIVLWHFCLTVLTGLFWNTLFVAAGHHHSPFMLQSVYASVWLFVPFCQPFFWPMSDWVARSGHFTLFDSSWLMELVEYLAIACLNSLSAVTLLLGAVWLVRFSRTCPRKQTSI